MYVSESIIICILVWLLVFCFSISMGSYFDKKEISYRIYVLGILIATICTVITAIYLL